MRNDLSLEVKQCLQPLLGLSHFSGQKMHLLLGLSGGLDSSVLLHVLAALQDELGFTLSAMHVHHGLSPNADAWATFCMKLCQQYVVPLEVVRVNLEKNGLGVEAAARHARYQALHAVNADFVVLAHHQDDQAETVLLQLARGAGLKGLAAMPVVDRQKKRLRPLLHLSRVALEQYAKTHHLQWIEDESNTDIGYDRNFMRHQVLPVLQVRYPAIATTISRAASHIAEANVLLDELARQDAAASNDFDCEGYPSKLSVAGLEAVSIERAANILRWWLVKQHQMMPNAAKLHELHHQLCSAKPDAQMVVQISPDHTIRRYQGYAYLVPEFVACTETVLIWQGESEIQLPDRRKLRFTEIQGDGIAKHLLQSEQVEIRYRHGDARIKLHPKQPSRTLKYIFQHAHIPPWQRNQYPLIYLGDKLVAIPSVGVAVDTQAMPSVCGIRITVHNGEASF